VINDNIKTLTGNDLKDNNGRESVLSSNSNGIEY